MLTCTTWKYWFWRILWLTKKAWNHDLFFVLLYKNLCWTVLSASHIKSYLKLSFYKFPSKRIFPGFIKSFQKKIQWANLHSFSLSCCQRLPASSRVTISYLFSYSLFSYLFMHISYAFHTHFWFLSIYPKNICKSEVFLCFQRLWKGTNSMRQVRQKK